MNKLLKSLVFGLGFCMLVSSVACGSAGGNSDGGLSGSDSVASGSSVSASGSGSAGGTSDSGSGGSSSGGSSPVKATVNFYTSVNIIEQRALQNVAYAYEDLQYDLGNDITISLVNNTDPDAYTQNLRNMLTSSVSNPTIACVSNLTDYYGTSKLLDLSGYLEEPNPYIAGNESWMDALESDAYRAQQTGGRVTVPGVSYSATYLTVFYNKSAMKAVMGNDDAVAADGTVDSSKVTWEWMLDALAAAKNADLNFKNPLGLSLSEQSCGEDGFNMLGLIVNMYLDQYFRDFSNTVHSQEGDYSYVSGIDGNWTYDPSDETNDFTGNYTYNLNRVVDSFFNSSEYSPVSTRYSEVMENLYALMRYADAESSYNDIFSRFNETTITFEGKGGSYSDMKLFYIEDLAYVRTYRDAFKTQSGGVTYYPDGEKISSELGWFLLPAMSSEIDGVADNLRPYGGPNENFGVLSTGSTSADEVAVDFLEYLCSPAGQAQIYATYVSENNAPIVMRQLVKGVEVPAAIDYTKVVSAKGDCNTAPYLIFAKGTGMKTCTVGNTNTYIKAEIARVLSSYFCGSSPTWNGTEMYSILKSGFSSYASDNNMIYSDYANVANVTNNLKNSPFNTTT